MNPYEELKQTTDRLAEGRQKDRKVENKIRYNMELWEEAFKIGASKSLGDSAYRPHKPEEPEDYVCPVCHEDCKGNKIGVMHGSGKVRMHQACYVKAVTHDPSGYTFAFYGAYGLKLSEKKMNSIFYMLGTLYNRIVETMKMAQEDAIVRDEVLFYGEEATADDIDYVKEAEQPPEGKYEEVKNSRRGRGMSEAEIMQEVNRDTKNDPFAKYRKNSKVVEQEDETEESEEVEETTERSNDPFAKYRKSPKVAASGRKSSVRKRSFSKGSIEDVATLEDDEVKTKNDPFSKYRKKSHAKVEDEEPESIEELAESALKTKMTEFKSNDKRLKELLVLYKKVK